MSTNDKKDNENLGYALFVREYYVMIDLESMIEQLWREVRLKISCDSISQGINLLASSSVDFIVSDFMLNDGPAQEILDKTMWSKPVIIFSEFMDCVNLEKNSQNVSYVHKPVTKNELSKVLDNVRRKIMNVND